jgi:hypothetical protein
MKVTLWSFITFNFPLEIYTLKCLLSGHLGKGHCLYLGSAHILGPQEQTAYHIDQC